METNDRDRSPSALDDARQELEDKIQEIVREYEDETTGPLELDLSLVEGEGSGPGDEELRERIRSAVDAFHGKPLIEQSDIRVHKVTAMDSDEDGRIAVRVQYDYPDYQENEEAKGPTPIS